MTVAEASSNRWGGHYGEKKHCFGDDDISLCGSVAFTGSASELNYLRSGDKSCRRCVNVLQSIGAEKTP